MFIKKKKEKVLYVKTKETKYELQFQTVKIQQGLMMCFIL